MVAVEIATNEEIIVNHSHYNQTRLILDPAPTSHPGTYFIEYQVQMSDDFHGSNALISSAVSWQVDATMSKISYSSRIMFEESVTTLHYTPACSLSILTNIHF